MEWELYARISSMPMNKRQNICGHQQVEQIFTSKFENEKNVELNERKMSSQKENEQSQRRDILEDYLWIFTWVASKQKKSTFSTRLKRGQVKMEIKRNGDEKKREREKRRGRNKNDNDFVLPLNFRVFASLFGKNTKINRLKTGNTDRRSYSMLKTIIYRYSFYYTQCDDEFIAIYEDCHHKRHKTRMNTKKTFLWEDFIDFSMLLEMDFNEFKYKNTLLGIWCIFFLIDLEVNFFKMKKGREMSVLTWLCRIIWSHGIADASRAKETSGNRHLSLRVDWVLTFAKTLMKLFRIIFPSRLIVQTLRQIFQHSHSKICTKWLN